MASTTCGWCGRLAHMTMVGDIFKLWPSPLDRLARLDKGSGGDTFAAAFRCDDESCGRLSIGQAHLTHSPASQADLRQEMTEDPLEWIPQSVTRPRFPDVPEQIADTAGEAHACLSIDAHRGAVALARAVVEAAAKDKGITKGSLAQKIDALYEAGHIRPITREIAHEVREGGNEIAHGDLGDEPMPAEDAQAIVRLMDEILQEVYQGPAAMLRLKRSRVEREQRNKGQ